LTSAGQRLSIPASRLGLAVDGRASDVGPSVVLGSKTSDGTLYLQFAPLWRGRRLRAAFLTLDPMPGTLAGDDVPLEVFRLRGSWNSAPLVRGAESPLSLPRTRGIGRWSPGVPVRIDVTAIVHYYRQNPRETPGFAVRAAHQVPPGLALATGFAGGAPPRLELYLD
jgi:hypothetical protein